MRDGELVKELETGGLKAEIRKFFDLRLLVVYGFKEELKEKIKETAKREDVDCIKIKEHDKEIPGYYYKSKRLVYWQDISKIPDNYLEYLQKKQRRRVKRLLEKGLTVKIEDPVSEETFKDWFILYKQKIGKKEKGVEYIDKDWLKTSKSKKIGLFVYDKDELIAGYIMIKKEKNNEEYLSTGYGGYKDGYFKEGISHFLIYSFIDFARKRYKLISAGKDTNFYGHHLSSGLFLFKKEWGFVPEPTEEFEHFRILNYDKFEDVFLFISGKEKLVLNLFFREEIDEKKVENYRNNEVYELKVHKI